MIDEEVGYILDLGIEFRRPAHRQPEGAAGRRLRRGLRRLRRAARPRPRRSRPQGSGGQHPHRHRLAVVGLVRPYHQDRQARDRAGRRQHRDGLLPHLAPPRRRGRQGDRALRLRGDEGLALGKGRRHARGHPHPQLSWCPRNSRTTTASSPACCSRRSRPSTTPRAAATWCRRASPTSIFECDDVLVAIGQENAFPWIERDIGIEFDKWGMPVVDKVTMQSTLPRRVLRRRCGLRAQEHHLGGRARPRRGDLDRQVLPRRGPDERRPAADVLVVSQKMGIHEWSYDNAPTIDHRFKVPHRAKQEALKNIMAEVELGFDPQLAFKEAQRCLNCDVQTVFTGKPVHRVRRLRRHLPDGLHHLHRQRRGDGPARPAEGAGARTRRRTSTYRTRSRPAASWSRTRTSACIAGCAPSAARPAPGTCASSCIDIPRRAACRQARSPLKSAVNDFVVKFANVNGSGSASANELFARAILRMGVPVSPRNIFPSNIQGLPTWYEVRVTEKGHLGRRGGVDLMVAMNPQTWAEDVKEIEPGGYLFYDSTKPMPSSKFRDDITVIGVPLTAITNSTYTDPRQRQLFKNIIYVGALVGAARHRPRGDRSGCSASSSRARRSCSTPTSRRCISAATGSSSISTAAIGEAEGQAAPTRSATASSSKATAPPRSARSMAAPRCAPGIRSRRRPRWPRPSPGHCRRYRVDKETGKNRYAIVQAEDELASIGIVIGAGWNGARAFTATSGPGISLMTEFIGLAYFAEIPAVIINVQRGGPSTGMPTRTQQSDLLSCAYASHGDTKHVLLFPEDPKECFDFAADSARPRRPPADAGVRHDRPRHRHEPPPVRAVPLGRQARRSTAAR